MRITYPDLPVSARREEIREAIADHQVVIVAGETGSGKTTQLPKICLELGLGADSKMIGHTQPRRIAARSVAERIAHELGVELGDLVGYQVRFTDRTTAASRIKLMTDGILLAELQHDRDLRRYDTIIIDEAHERSLNIDFLLGYLKQLLPRRPDLKVIITSATIDTQRFAEHFARSDGSPAPIIEVSGRTYPVEIRYRPLMVEPESDEQGEVVVRDQTEAIVAAVKELSAEGPGDILVFLPGEREIRDTADALTSELGLGRAGRTPTVEIVPLYSRLSAAEQHKVFESHSGRRIVLATNVAETSLTVPGIRYVVDPGLARVSRYSVRTKVQRLPIEPISRASANQRSGRCGRVEAGIAIRLYDEADFEARPEFTDPEILRTNLASVILQMTSLGLGDIADFGFVEPPDRRTIEAGVHLLVELGAIKGRNPRLEGPRPSSRRGRDSGLTRIGRNLARMPIDPRLGRMILEAERLGCVREVVVIAAALSLQDPRERPGPEHPAERARADQLHARFTAEGSDFIAWLNLWDHLRTQQSELSSSAFRRMCRAEHLNYLRVREWQEFESQLRRIVKDLGINLGKPAQTPDTDGIHQALLSGLLSHIGSLIERPKTRPGAPRERPGPREYDGARGTRFAIFPGSSLARKNPDFVMAAELVETGRLWARQVAAIKPEWAERLAPHLVAKTHSDPFWSRKRAAVMAHEKVTLYGVPIVADRLVNYGRVDPVVARDLFITHGLVDGNWNTRHPFLRRNLDLLEQAGELEARARRRDIVVDDDTLFEFYDRRLPPQIVGGVEFDQWWKAQPDKQILDFDPDMLVRDHHIADTDFPTTWSVGPGEGFAISYNFHPGAADDGMTILIPLATLNQVDDDDFSWIVPGLREELVTTLIRSLPKQLRTPLVPVPDRVRSFLAETTPGAEPLMTALTKWIRATTGNHVPEQAWDWSRVPAHLLPTFKVVDESGRETARGRDLSLLKKPLAGEFSRAIATVAVDAGLSATGARSWTFDDIPVKLTQTRAGHEVTVHPALIDEGDSVGMEVFGSADDAAAVHRLGLARLVMVALPRVKAPDLDNATRLQVAVTPQGSLTALLADCRMAQVLDRIDAVGAARTRSGFEALVDQCRPLDPAALLPDVIAALSAWAQADRALSGRAEMSHLPSLTDMKTQVARLMGPSFVSDAGLGHLRRLPAYLRGVVVRRQRLDDPGGPARDRSAMGLVGPVERAWAQRVEVVPAATARLWQARWLLEELRLQQFAPEVRTATKVSDTRIRALLES
ncbi:MAG: ATP-dependent RNA helicase HrpA [Nocardioides sp.]